MVNFTAVERPPIQVVQQHFHASSSRERHDHIRCTIAIDRGVDLGRKGAVSVTGEAPVVKLTADWNFPSPTPSRTETVLRAWLGTIISALPSPLRSLRTTSDGATNPRDEGLAAEHRVCGSQIRFSVAAAHRTGSDPPASVHGAGTVGAGEGGSARILCTDTASPAFSARCRSGNVTRTVAALAIIAAM